MASPPLSQCNGVDDLREPLLRGTRVAVFGIARDRRGPLGLPGTIAGISGSEPPSFAVVLDSLHEDLLVVDVGVHDVVRLRPSCSVFNPS
jgi:hypothetical protein